ncbi:MAG: PTS system mannose-specific EIIAB component [Eubacteriales bacterium]|jgi:N-acetylgalactosamine PTS system EIIA component
MIGVLITGHGSFATGMMSASKLIVGPRENYLGVDFLESDNVDTLSDKLRQAMESLGDQILVLVDLAGGSPFKTAVTLKSEFPDKKIEVISGLNLPMLTSVLLEEKETMEEYVQDAMEMGAVGIKQFKKKPKPQPVAAEDGI